MNRKRSDEEGRTEHLLSISSPNNLGIGVDTRLVAKLGLYSTSFISAWRQWSREALNSILTTEPVCKSTCNLLIACVTFL